MDNEIKKQSIGYEPSIEYTKDYYAQSNNDVTQTNIDLNNRFNYADDNKFDTTTIPSIGEDIKYIDAVLKAVPAEVANAIKEVYDPIKAIYNELLWDKIVDPDPPRPGVEIIHPDKEPIDIDIDNYIPYPFIMLPLTKDDENDKDGKDDNYIPHSISIEPIPVDDNPGNGDPIPDIDYPHTFPPDPYPPGGNDDDDDHNIHFNYTYPIVILPIGDQYMTPDIDDPYIDSDHDDDDPDMWDPVDTEVKVIDPDYEDLVEREFVYLITKMFKFYTSRLKDVINNYIFTVYRASHGHTNDETKIIMSPLEISNDDVYTKCKHLLDISLQSQSKVGMKTAYLANAFNIFNTISNLQAFITAQRLRRRYSGINYSVGNSMTNAASDHMLQGLSSEYEVRFRNSYENSYRYLNSSLLITEDLFKTMQRDILSKETLIKKGGIK